MQSDAYEANIIALGGAIRSATTLANTKAILGGFDKDSKTYTDTRYQKVAPEDADFVFVRGYPAASERGIIAMLQNSDRFVHEDQLDKANSNTEYILKGNNDDEAKAALHIKPYRRSNENDGCKITYTAANQSSSPKIEVNSKKC